MKKPTKDVKRYIPDVHVGLTDEDVADRKLLNLSNKVKIKTSKTYLQIISGNVLSLFNIIIYCIFAFMLVCKYVFLFDVPITKFLFVLPALFNMLIGIIQETKSKITLDKLSLIQKNNYIVIRNKCEYEISADDILADDIFKLQAGQQIPVDAIVLSGSLEVNESILTGESDNVIKDVNSELMSSSYVVSGSAICYCKHVGVDTYASKLQTKMKEINNSKSELMSNIKNVIKITTALLIIIFIISTFSSIYKMNKWNELTWNDVVLGVAAITIGCVPNGLVLLTSVTLAVSVVRLSRKKILVQELFSLENLSRIDMICLDKTGTLTTGHMEVKNEILFTDKIKFEEYIGSFLRVNASNNQTGIALLNKYKTNEIYQELEVIPFSSDRKIAIVKLKNGDILTLGAPEYLTSSDYILDKSYKYANEGLRVLAFKHNDDVLALILISDIIRDNVEETIQYFYENNVDIKIISGDNPFTVSKIAQKCGVKNADKCINMQDILPEDIDSIVDNFTVFGRITPEQKELIIKALQRRGHKVAMTGDGVNDVLALKAANCSISFNTATQSAKNISDVVLLDDSFSAIPSIVLEGRKVVNNITRTAILFLSKTAFIVLFALFSLLTKEGVTLLNNESLYIFETCIVALGGFMLSQEPNKQPITGTFKANVYSKAISNGAFICIAAMIPIIMLGIGTIKTPELAQSMLSVMITVAAYIVFWKLIDPVNIYKGTVFTVCLIIGLMLIFAFPSVFINPYDIKSFTDIFNGTFNLDKSIFNDFTTEMYIAIIIFIAVCIPAYLIINFLITFMLDRNEKMRKLLFKTKKD